MTGRLRVIWFYADRLNTYADRGNIVVLERRCQRRGIEVAVARVGLGDRFDPSTADLVYLGGGQDRDQRRCSQDLVRHREALLLAVDRGAVVLGVCGGYQLLGHEYVLGDEAFAGVGLLDVRTAAPPPPEDHRLVGPAVIQVTGFDLPTGSADRLAGFENHRGRSTLGPAAAPLGRVLAGHGNDGVGGTEGAVSGRVIGTYLHGPLLAKNAWFADALISLATGQELQPLEDRFESAVHRDAIARGLAGGRSPIEAGGPHPPPPATTAEPR